VIDTVERLRQVLERAPSKARIAIACRHIDHPEEAEPIAGVIANVAWVPEHPEYTSLEEIERAKEINPGGPPIELIWIAVSDAWKDTPPVGAWEPSHSL
jgi:hypothetical protein